MAGKTLGRIPDANAFLLICALLLCSAFLSCGNDDGSAPREDALTVGIVYDTAGREDRSFNESAYMGIKRAEAELGAIVSEQTTDGSESNREKLVRSLASDNDLVIAVGFSFDSSIKKIAAEYPGTNFAGVDIQQGNNPPANFASLLFSEEEGAFLVGAAAALITRTNKVGFIGGVCSTPERIIEKFEAGFVEGAWIWKLGIEIETEYLSHEDLSGFSDTEEAEKVAGNMFDNGADVIFHAAGASGTGLFRAAADKSEGGEHLWAIGVDSDQYRTADESLRGHILTSMLKRVDVAVYNIIEAQKNGEFRGGALRHNLANGGVDYSMSGNFLEEHVIRRLELSKEWIRKGSLTVPKVPLKDCAQPQTYP